MDINEGMFVRVDGQMTVNNSIPIDALIKMATSLQKLIYDVAKNDINPDETISLDNFKLELCGFKGGSAVPQFKYNTVIQASVYDITSQRKKVSEVVTKILNITESGKYGDLKDLYPSNEIRNTILKDMYDFTNSVGDAKLSIVKEDLTPIVSIHRLKKSAYDKYYTDIMESVALDDFTPSTKIGKIKVGKKKNTIIEVYDDKKSADYSPSALNYFGITYELKYPLRSKYDTLDGMILIENEMLGIYAYGQDDLEAEEMFSEEFHYLYTRYNELSNEQMDSGAIFIKQLINNIVQKVINH